MKHLARIPIVFALVAMVAACTDMTAPEVTPPQFSHVAQCPPGWLTVTLQTSNPAAGRLSGRQFCVQNGQISRGGGGLGGG